MIRVFAGRNESKPLSGQSPSYLNFNLWLGPGILLLRRIVYKSRPCYLTQQVVALQHGARVHSVGIDQFEWLRIMGEVKR